MMETAIDRIWEFVIGAIAPDPEAFRLIRILPSGGQVALFVILLAGLLEAIGQSIVLFVNQVKPIRFVLNRGIAVATITSLGAVGHSSGGGLFDRQRRLPHGRTGFQQTIDWVARILMGKSSSIRKLQPHKLSNYDRYQQADFNRPSFYPLKQNLNPSLYHPIAPWIGRLILPPQSERTQLRGVLFEIHHAPPQYRQLLGRIAILRWSDKPSTQAFVRAVTKDLHFNDKAKYSQSQGTVHPHRLNHWQQVDPLESLAGSRPHDDVIVALPASTQFTPHSHPPASHPPSSLLAFLPCLTIAREPVQITGRFYALVKILHPIAPASDRFRVVHFNATTRQFNGVRDTIRIPQVIADANGCFPSSYHQIETTPANNAGWYIYGAADRSGLFTVQAIAPRALLSLKPDTVVTGKAAIWKYVKHQSWQIKGKKGRTRSVLCNSQSITRHLPTPSSPPQSPSSASWKEGDRALLLHVYGGIGGKKREPSARTPIFFGHFAYGVATVVREPLANELMFDIHYHQVYTHNTDGLIAGTLAWPCYMGDRQFGWLGIRPVRDILVKLEAFTGDFDIQGTRYSALDLLVEQLERMTARYRIGDGTGGTYVGPAHNCAQDSNQALYTALKQMRESIRKNPELQQWLQDDPGEAERYDQLVVLTQGIRRKLLPLGAARADWREGKQTLGISPEENLIQGVLTGLRSWRTLLPRLAAETIVYEFLKQGATVWVLETNQVGGYDPDMEPIPPTPIGW